MKKIILMLLVMFSFILVNAEETVNVRVEWIPNVYYNYEKNGLNYWGQFAYIYANDKVAYCLDLSQNINSTTYTKTDEIQNNNLVILAGYFGYGYDGNINLKDYMATQKLIWQFLGTKIHFTTKSNGAGESIDIMDNELRIRYKINNHATFPAYDSNFKFIAGSSNNLIQQNNINNGYNILNSSSNIIEFTKDGLLFNAKETGNNNFYLETKYPKNFENEIYIADNSQKIMVIGGVENLRREYNYEVIGGTLSIKVKYDKMIDKSKLYENEFEIYDDNQELLGIYRPDIDGNIIVSNLALGKYKIKHLSVSEGYNVSSYEDEFEITEEFLHQTKEINLYLKTINVMINKTFSNPLINDLNYDEGIIYKIYDSNDNYINEVITDKYGNASFKLEYGNYKIVQLNVNNVDIYHSNILIDKSMFEEDLILNIHDDIYKAKIKVLVLDGTNNEPISNLNFKMNGEEKVTSEEGIYITNLLSFGIYEFSNIKKDGYLEYKKFDYKLDENNMYYIFDNEVYVDLVLYLEQEKEPQILEEQDKVEEILNEIEKENSSNDVIESIENENSGIDSSTEDILKEEDISGDNIDKTSLNGEDYNGMVKLPFLGEDIKRNENTKIYNFINYLFNYSWMFVTWI